MNGKENAESHQRNAEKYLRDTESAYILDLKSGLYQPASWQRHEAPSQEPYRHIDNKRPKGSAADWTGVVISIIGIAISAATLIGLIFTVAFSIKQWDEAHRTADASIISAEATRSASRTAARTLAKMQKGQGAKDTHTLAQQALAQTQATQAMVNLQSNQAAEKLGYALVSLHIVTLYHDVKNRIFVDIVVTQTKETTIDIATSLGTSKPSQKQRHSPSTFFPAHTYGQLPNEKTTRTYLPINAPNTGTIYVWGTIRQTDSPNTPAQISAAFCRYAPVAKILKLKPEPESGVTPSDALDKDAFPYVVPPNNQCPDK